MKKKILIVCILAILLASISAVSADGFLDDHIKLGVTYNVPEGYTFEGTYSLSGSDPDSYSKGTKYLYESDTNPLDEIHVNIYELTNPLDTIDDIRQDIPASAQKTTINGVDGYLETYPSQVCFYYIQNGKLIILVAPDKATVEDMVSPGIF